MKLLTILFAAFLITGCGSKTITVSAELDCPVPLVLPVASESVKAEIQTLSDETYTYFVQRDKLQTARRETLQEICRSTHNS